MTEQLPETQAAHRLAGPPSAARPEVPGVASALGRALWPSAERALLGVLLVGAALARLAGLGQIEPNVSAIEVSHLTAIEALVLDRGPGFLSWTDAGASGLALVVPTMLRLLRPDPEAIPRLYAALGSIAFLALFYAVCRSRHGALVSLVTTGLLAFAPWSLFFGRNGELNIFAGLWLLVAVWSLRRALRERDPRLWVLAGAASTAGLYWHPSAVWTLPALAGFLPWGRLARPERRAQLTTGLTLMLAAALVVAVPRLPGLVDRGPATPIPAEQPAGPAAPTGSLRVTVQDTLRAFVLLDPTVTGDPRYLPPGRAPLDAVTGLLLLGGLGMAVWRPRACAGPLTLFLVPLLGSQLAAGRAPALGDAVVALPGLYLLVAAALDRLDTALPWRAISRAALLVAVAAYALAGWSAYTAWQATPAVAQARQPALDYDEIDLWLAELRGRLLAGQPALTAREWREQHPRLMTGARALRRPRGSAPARGGPDLTRVELRQVGILEGEPGPGAPRGIAAGPAGDVLVATVAGRISRADAQARAPSPLPQQPPALEQVSELAVDAEGFVYLADAERSVLVKVDPHGAEVGTIATDWGMYRPRGMSIGPDGLLYIADTGRNRIVVGSTDGRLRRTIGPPATADLEQPTDIAVDASGRIYVTLPEVGQLVVLDDGGQKIGGWAIPKGNTVESGRVVVVSDGVIAVADPVERKVRLVDADGRELQVAEVPGAPYGAAVTGDRLYVTIPSTGRIVVFALGPG